MYIHTLIDIEVFMDEIALTRMRYGCYWQVRSVLASTGDGWRRQSGAGSGADEGGGGGGSWGGSVQSWAAKLQAAAVATGARRSF